MARAAAGSRPAAARRPGYLIGAAVGAVLLYLVNVWPGWQSVPFLTADTRHVVDVVNASILVNVVANLVYLVHDPPWLRAVGSTVTLAVGLLALIRIWRVFPFYLGPAWAVVVHVLLAVAVVGSCIGILAAFVSFMRWTTREG